MACYRLSLLKSLVSSLSGGISRSSSQSYRALSHSSSFLKSANIQNNIIHSPFPDCELHNDSITQHFFGLAGRWPNHVAVECGITGRKYTYGQVRALSCRFGSALVRMGFKRGEVLGMVLPNLPEFPIVMFGASGIGMPVTTVNPIYNIEEIARQMQGSETTVLVCIPQMAEAMKEVARLCPSIRRMIVIGSAEGFVSISDMFQDSGDFFDDNIEIDTKNETFFMPYSSGTTGMPKGVMLTHYSSCSNIQQFNVKGTTKTVAASDSFQETFICVLPFFHIYGLFSIMLFGFEKGAKLVTLPRFDPKSFITAVNQHEPTIVHMVPPLVTFLGHNNDWDKKAFHRTHTMPCGAAPLGAAATTKLLERIDRPDFLIQNVFGMTEAGGCIIAPICDANKIGSCGQPISRSLAKVVDINTGEALGPNEEGELCIYGPNVMKGYYKNEKATRDTIDSDGWLHSGDIATYDEDGQFFIVDRLKELIKVKGLQVAPSELEDMLRRHPAVVEAAVIGIEDEKAGELPRAYIVKKPNFSSTSSEDIQNFISEKVAPHKQLKGGVVFIDTIPTSVTGKILRRELKAQLSQIS